MVEVPLNSFKSLIFELKPISVIGFTLMFKDYITPVVFQALGMLARELYLEGIPEEELVKWLARLQEIDWRRSNELWRERGVTQMGATGEPIIQNTKTTVDACHKVLREFIGIAPVSGVV